VKSFTAIDEQRLDQEWIDHPPLVEEWAIKKADADHEVRLAKDFLTLVKAEIRARVRTYPSKYGLDAKSTKDDIAAAVDSHRRVRKALAALRECERAAGLAGAAMEALDHRRTAMSKTVELWQMGFRSEPRARSRRARRGLERRE
jgi:hypothetical protein